MRELPHAPGYTLAADAFMGPDELIGFSIAHHPLSVFMHFHDFYELALITRGVGLHFTSAGEQVVRRGSAIFVAPGVSHGYRMCDDLVAYNCFLRAEAAQFDLPWASRDQRLGSLFNVPGREPAHPAMVSLAEADLVECLGHLDAIRGRPPEARSEAHDLGHLLLALDVLARSLERQRPERAPADRRAPSLVASAIEMLEHDLGRHWTLDELSERLYVGPFHLVRQFKRWVGLPPMAYLNRRRSERAAMLLSTTEDAIASIGSAVGWIDPAHFSRRFHHAFGMSPRAYRAQSGSIHLSREGRPGYPPVPRPEPPDIGGSA